jgi:hypothetical protein
MPREFLAEQPEDFQPRSPAQETPRQLNGDLVTVDGHWGIVTVGPPEFDLEI